MRTPDFFIAPLETVQDHRLSLMQTRVLQALLSFRNKETNLVCPSRSTLSERAGYSVDVISRTTSQLVKLGWLKKSGNRGRSRASLYEITVPEIRQKKVTEPVKVTESVNFTDSDGKRLPIRTGKGYRSGKEHITDKEQTKNKDMSSSSNNTGQVRLIFDFWKTEFNHPKAKLDSKRSRAIKARLKDGYTVDDIQKAITGCKQSPFHQGENERHTIYDGIDLICRDADKLEGFISRADQSSPVNYLAEVCNA